MANADSIECYRLSNHAKDQMRRRQIKEENVSNTLIDPEHVETVNEGCKIYQKLIYSDDIRKSYLLRIIVDTDYEPPEVVTVYRTSKISKYWRNEP